MQPAFLICSWYFDLFMRICHEKLFTRDEFILRNKDVIKGIENNCLNRQEDLLMGTLLVLVGDETISFQNNFAIGCFSRLVQLDSGLSLNRWWWASCISGYFSFWYLIRLWTEFWNQFLNQENWVHEKNVCILINAYVVTEIMTQDKGRQWIIGIQVV